jgi:hypothetical protein
MRAVTSLWLALQQVLLFLGIVAFQFFAALVSGVGCGDDGVVDYGTANAVQHRYCKLVWELWSNWTYWLPFASPLFVFVLANGVRRLRSRWKPLLASAPLVVVTGVVPILIMLS